MEIRKRPVFRHTSFKDLHTRNVCSLIFTLHSHLQVRVFVLFLRMWLTTVCQRSEIIILWDYCRNIAKIVFIVKCGNVCDRPWLLFPGVGIDSFLTVSRPASGGHLHLSSMLRMENVPLLPRTSLSAWSIFKAKKTQLGGGNCNRTISDDNLRFQHKSFKVFKNDSVFLRSAVNVRLFEKC